MFTGNYESAIQFPEHQTHENIENHKLHLMDLLNQVESELDILFNHDEFTIYETEITEHIKTCEDIINHLNSL